MCLSVSPWSLFIFSFTSNWPKEIHFLPRWFTSFMNTWHYLVNFFDNSSIFCFRKMAFLWKTENIFIRSGNYYEISLVTRTKIKWNENGVCYCKWMTKNLHISTSLSSYEACFLKRTNNCMGSILKLFFHTFGQWNF